MNTAPIDLATTAIPFPMKPDGLPEGFRLRPDGIYHEVMLSTGDTDWARLCSPIRVLALARSRDGTDWGRHVEITDPDGRRHRWSIPAELFAGDGQEVRREALRLGLDLASGKSARAVFSDLLMRWQPKTRATTTSRLGWTGEDCAAFVLGSGRVFGDEDVVYQADQVQDVAAEMRPAGTLEDWRDTVAASCQGNPILMGCVSLAFAGPLLEPLGTEGGGLHLRGASSRGKSTAQRAAVSVWGAPAFLRTWRATSNGLEGVALACNATLLALDEMGEVDGREAGQVAYMLANGVGKTRASRTGTARPSARWKTMILSSGEIRLADKMAESGRHVKAGQDIRLLDIQADERVYGTFDTLHGHADGAAFAAALNRAAAKGYGTAGPAFVEALLADLPGVTAKARAHCDAFVAEALAQHRIAGREADGQLQRAAKRFGLIAAAGELATTFGLTGWSPGEAREATTVLFGLWLDGRGGTGSVEARQAIARTREFLTRHGSSRFELIGEGVGSVMVRDRAGWRSGEHFYIAGDIWEREVHAGSDARRAAQHLRDAGYLHTEGKGLTVKTPRAVDKRPRAYAVKQSILAAGDE